MESKVVRIRVHDHLDLGTEHCAGSCLGNDLDPVASGGDPRVHDQSPSPKGIAVPETRLDRLELQPDAFGTRLERQCSCVGQGFLEGTVHRDGLARKDWVLIGRLSKPGYESVQNGEKEDGANQGADLSDPASPPECLVFIHEKPGSSPTGSCKGEDRRAQTSVSPERSVPLIPRVSAATS